VHSLKDVASSLVPRLELAAILRRDDARDAFICSRAKTLGDLPAGSVVGTSSLRRQAQVLARRPDLRVLPLRGNIETRLKKLESGQADATILAVAGMARLGVDHRIASIMTVADMLPAAGQGALSVEIRSDDDAARSLLKALDDGDTRACTTAERAVMRAIDGTCHTPAGAYATLKNGQLSIEALVARADGSDLIRLSATGEARDADAVGEALGRELRRNSPADLFAA
jgi:hydroxymethylbilane synthase